MNANYDAVETLKAWVSQYLSRNESGWGAAKAMVLAPSQPYSWAEFKAEAILPGALYYFRLIASVQVGSVSSESLVAGLKVISEGLVHSD